MHPTPSYSPVEGKVSKGTLSRSGPKLFRAWCILGLGLAGVHVGLGLVLGVRLGFIYINCRLGLGLGFGLGPVPDFIHQKPPSLLPPLL